MQYLMGWWKERDFRRGSRAIQPAASSSGATDSTHRNSLLASVLALSPAAVAQESGVFAVVRRYRSQSSMPTSPVEWASIGSLVRD